MIHLHPRQKGDRDSLWGIKVTLVNISMSKSHSHMEGSTWKSSRNTSIDLWQTQTMSLHLPARPAPSSKSDLSLSLCLCVTGCYLVWHMAFTLASVQETRPSGQPENSSLGFHALSFISTSQSCHWSKSGLLTGHCNGVTPHFLLLLGQLPFETSFTPPAQILLTRFIKYDLAFMG